MRVQSIHVRKLFEMFDHDIDLDSPERIRILHGPNGFGKTTILRMIDDFFLRRYSRLRLVPFQEFRISFDDNRTVVITRKPSDEASLAITLINGQSVLDTAEINERSPVERRLAMSYLSREVPGLVREDSRTFRYVPTGEEFSTEEAMYRFADVLPSRFRSAAPERDWLLELTKSITVRLIESQRLQSTARRPRYDVDDTGEAQEPAVTAYSRELARKIRSTLAEYGTLSQGLDRTFPRRIIDEIENYPEGNQPSDVDGIRALLNNLETRREKLRQVGLLDRQDDVEPQPPSALKSTTQKVLSIYAEDTATKLRVFDQLAAQIDLFQQIIGSKFFNKRLTVNRESGFQVEIGKSGDAGKPLKVTQLSTGEQHMLVLMYELLFRVPTNALVMIDEPEISLHVAWQQEFLHDLEKITKLANFDALIATHSPQIIHERWDLTQELHNGLDAGEED